MINKGQVNHLPTESKGFVKSFWKAPQKIEKSPVQAKLHRSVRILPAETFSELIENSDHGEFWQRRHSLIAAISRPVGHQGLFFFKIRLHRPYPIFVAEYLCGLKSYEFCACYDGLMSPVAPDGLLKFPCMDRRIVNDL